LRPDRTGADGVETGEAQLADPPKDVARRGETGLVVQDEMSNVRLE
jgi:hypothetical protein